jgi:hypothetical protein
VRTITALIFVGVLACGNASAQSGAVPAAAEQIIQPSQSAATVISDPAKSEVKLPAGTPIEVEVAYTVNSIDVKPGERISFRVLVPIVIDDVTLIEKGALVTARITQAKRGGHWGKGGRLVWSMEDVVAADNSRVLLAPETASRDEKIWSLETGRATKPTTVGQGRVKGTSHTGEVATMAVVSGVLFPPLALLGGFKRGENAVLREGRRFVVTVGKDATVKVVATGNALKN